jgi:uncharacterized membrane protein YdjX (TVP38/TMEM64 family)
MVVDDELVRIGSANLSHRSMGVDTECDLAVVAAGGARVRHGIRHIRDRLLGEHLALPVDAVARELERRGSLRALIDERQRAEHTLLPIELPEAAAPLPEALRAAADPEEPILSGSPISGVIPAADTTTRHGPFRFRIAIAVALTSALVAGSTTFIERPEFQALQDALTSTPRSSFPFWIAFAIFLLGNLVLVPLELMAIAAGVLFGAILGGLVALAGSAVAASVGYVAGRAIGPAGLRRWMSRRAYRSARQLGAQGIVGVLVLRLASVASAGSVHLLGGAGRVPFSIYLVGTLIGLAPAVFALGGLGALLRRTLLEPSLSNVLITLAAAALVIVVAALVRALLLLRRYGPSVARHRARAEFG